MHYVALGSNSIRVMENQEYRWLLMNETVQSVMQLDQPPALVLPHLHAMFMCLYFQRNPSKAVELGLGAGAARRFWQHYLPESQLLSIEYEPTIIQCYQDYFKLGEHSEEIVEADAEQAVKNCSNIDLLMVDLFAYEQTPAFLNEASFYQDCFSALNQEGLLVLNLLPYGELHTQHILTLLQDITGHKPMVFAVPKYKNRLIFSSRQPLPRIDFGPELLQFCQQYHIDLQNIMQLS